jgi:hypothetical protein
LAKARKVKKKPSSEPDEEEEQDLDVDNGNNSLDNNSACSEVIDDVINEEDIENDDIATAAGFISKNGVFGDKSKQIIDLYTQRLGRCCKDFSRAYFSQGISTNSKKNGFEEVLVILLVMIALCSNGIGDELCKQMDQYQTKDSVAQSDSWIELFASILLMDDCLHWNWIKREELLDLRKYIPLFLNGIKQWKIAKKEFT